MPSTTPHLALTRLSSRADFLHKLPLGNHTSKKLPLALPISRCLVDEMPFKYLQLGLFIPSIMRRVEIYMLATILSTTLLKYVAIQDVNLILTAISTSNALENRNYQRLEFIGDAILKLSTSIQIITQNPLWHEGVRTISILKSLLLL